MTNEPMNPNEPDDVESTEPEIDPESDFETESDFDPVPPLVDEDFGYAPPPPVEGATYAGSPRTEGLVRDPFAKLGGIASGIAHRYAWDVTLVRLVFVLALFASFGTAVFFYFIAWIVIPRATVWPPQTVRMQSGGFSNRDIGIGLAILGALTFTAVSGGSAGAILVPLALVGGGVWLLTQAPRESEYLTGVPTQSASAGPMPPAPSFATPPPPVSYAVAPRSRRRKFFIGAFLAFAALIMLTLIAGTVLFATTGTFKHDGFQISIDGTELGFERHTPRSLAELDRLVQLDIGAIQIDLRDIPDSDWATLTEPVGLDISLDDGEVKLIIPDDINFQIDALVQTGSISQTEEGRFVDSVRGQVTVLDDRAVELTKAASDSMIDITVRIDDGNLEVVQVDG